MRERCIDLVLASFLATTDPVQREELLAELMLKHVAPLVRSVLRQQLGFSVGRNGERPTNSDAADLYQEILTRVIGRLRERTMMPEAQGITDFISYVARIARNSCHDYLRIKYPIRHLLKKKLRYLLLAHREYQLWPSGYKQLCGHYEWKSIPPNPDRATDEALVELVRSGLDLNSIPAAKVLEEVVRVILDNLTSPIEIDHLVTIVSRITESSELILESIDGDHYSQLVHLHAPTLNADQLIESGELMNRLWEELIKLPLLQRRILLLGGRDRDRDGLGTILIDAGVIDLPVLLGTIEMLPDKFRNLAERLPLDGQTLARYLGISSKDLIRTRYRARQKLKKSIPEWFLKQ